MQGTSEKNFKIMSWIAIGIGLLMIAVTPFITQISLERVLVGLIAHIDDGFPAFTSGIALFDFFYPVWRAIIFVAGVTLIVISQEIKKGEEWTYGLAMFLFAMPAIGGMFMFLPYVSWVEGFPLPLIISAIGLAGYWSFIFLRKGAMIEKWARLGALTFIGMLTTHAFTIGVGAQRTMATRPGYPYYKDFSWWLFGWAGEVNWIVAVLLLISIPLLAAGKKRGWWLAVISAITIFVIDAPTQIIRTKTLDYLYGALLAGGLLFFLMVPYFKVHLFNHVADEAVEEDDAVEEGEALEAEPA